MKVTTAQPKPRTADVLSPARIAVISRESPVPLDGKMRRSIESSQGQQLPNRVRPAFENAFAHDFSRVRAHTDPVADSVCREARAQALSVGNDVFFRSQLYRPDTDAGVGLIAHELTHIVQGGNPLHVRRQREGEKVISPLQPGAHAAIAKSNAGAAEQQKMSGPDPAPATIYVTNKSATTIYYKPEDDSTALPVEANSIGEKPIDGVATHKHRDKVYKAVTGATVTVDEDGDVDTDFSGKGSFKGTLGQWALGGWKDKDWLAGRHAEKPKPDHGWDALFDKAAVIVAPPERPNVFEDIWQKTRRGLQELDNWGR